MADYKLSDIAQNEMREFAMYTIESRAIPNMIDGLKPVQRFYLYSSIQNTPKDFKKVSAVSGVVSDYGYNHGEPIQNTPALAWLDSLDQLQSLGIKELS